MLIHVKHLEGNPAQGKCLCGLFSIGPPAALSPPTLHSPIFSLLACSRKGNLCGGLQAPRFSCLQLQFGLSQWEEASGSPGGGAERAQGISFSAPAHLSGRDPALPLLNPARWPFLHCRSDTVRSLCPRGSGRLTRSPLLAGP